jgi:natural product precursor
MARRPVMNQSKKLELSKETLRCLDDQDLTDVAGGHDRHGGGNNNSAVLGVCITAQGYSCVCDSVGICLG